MLKTEIDELIGIRNITDLLKLYPTAKKVDSKDGFVFYSIKPNVWIKCFYFMKDGTCCRDLTSGLEEDIDYDIFTLDKIYTGNEKTEEYKYIWKYAIPIEKRAKK